mmetsp:Transcript_32691/g.50979  ORF Transcript_32691/g.50979 Transcript_32691/m.50979 type:complete len:100 (+) Transcript_32691:68-367(+)
MLASDIDSSSQISTLRPQLSTASDMRAVCSLMLRPSPCDVHMLASVLTCHRPFHSSSFSEMQVLSSLSIAKLCVIPHWQLTILRSHDFPQLVSISLFKY